MIDEATLDRAVSAGILDAAQRDALVALTEVDHIRLDTRLDFSVRASIVLPNGRKIRVPFEATPPHQAFEDALTETVGWYLEHEDWRKAIQDEGDTRSRQGLTAATKGAAETDEAATGNTGGRS